MSFWDSLHQDIVWMTLSALVFGYGIIFFLNPEFIWNLDHLDKIMVSFGLGAIPLVSIGIGRRLHDGLHHTDLSSEYVDTWLKNASTLMIFAGPVLISLRLLAFVL